MSELIKKEAKIAKGSSKPLQEKVGKLTKAQVKAIAEKKLPDLNVNSVEAAMRLVEGTARQMGVTIEG
jgi:large subunit ribosomal protein L11